MIELRTINENNYTDCLNLKASVANENFVDSVAYSLAEAWVHYKDTKPFAIYADETMIGFVSMYVGEENYQIINFLIDDAYQKKGYGTAAAKLCIDFLYKEYKALADKEYKVIFGGRLGEYRYYDMDAVIDRALKLAGKRFEN